MAVRLVVTLKTKKGKGGDFAKAFGKLIPGVLKEPGCEQYALFQNTQDADTLVMIERWKSQAALDKHMAAMQAKGALPGMDAITGKPTMERYEV
ncbi:MAG: antibiotic biosynthesis monooxygenase [Dehalococcoidia bacterium]|nr:antibiotic biosynthesis monooxygenase [Dehalococcoidia bacterium]